MVGDQPIYQTPSVNLTVAFNVLDKLPHTLEVKKVHAHIMATQVQVNEIRNDAPSYSATLACSRRSRCNGEAQHHGINAPRPQGRGPYLYRGSGGNCEANSRHDDRPP